MTVKFEYTDPEGRMVRIEGDDTLTLSSKSYRLSSPSECRGRYQVFGPGNEPQLFEPEEDPDVALGKALEGIERTIERCQEEMRQLRWMRHAVKMKELSREIDEFGEAVAKLVYITFTVVHSPIKVIKEIRERTGLSLKYAKEAMQMGEVQMLEPKVAKSLVQAIEPYCKDIVVG